MYAIAITNENRTVAVASLTRKGYKWASGEELDKFRPADEFSLLASPENGQVYQGPAGQETLADMSKTTGAEIVTSVDDIPLAKEFVAWEDPFEQLMKLLGGENKRPDISNQKGIGVVPLNQEELDTLSVVLADQGYRMFNGKDDVTPGYFDFSFIENANVFIVVIPEIKVAAYWESGLEVKPGENCPEGFEITEIIGVGRVIGKLTTVH